MENSASLTVADVARRLNTSPEAVQRWLHDGLLHASAAGGELRVDESELHRFITAAETVQDDGQIQDGDVDLDG